ncbi:hypothetical protein HanXRQr2_Chr01g0033741 [Helianthus annuus]|nr:hypothetical protein HanXRQr2_Chr01g0033741 [Helianthus annuus]
MEEPGLPSVTLLAFGQTGGGLWWLTSYRKRKAEESKGTVVVGAGGIRGRRPSCTPKMGTTMAVAIFLAVARVQFRRR